MDPIALLNHFGATVTSWTSPPRRTAASRRSDGLAQSVASLNDDALFEAALRDASTLLAVPIVREDVLDWDVVRWAGAVYLALAQGVRQQSVIEERVEPQLTRV